MDTASEQRRDELTATTVDPAIVESVRIVYADGRHNIAPDVIAWRGNFYLTFSNGSNHVAWDHHGIIMRSDNLRDWKTIYRTSFQARDAFFAVLRDRLFMYFIVYHHPEDKEHGWVETRVTYTDDGETWSEPQRVHERGHNFWRPKVHDGRIYVASDTLIQEDGSKPDVSEESGGNADRRIVLLESTDGLAWSEVSTVTRGGTETSIHFRPDDELWVITRSRWFSRAKPPYKNWDVQRLPEGHGFAGPAVAEINGHVYVAGRYYKLPRDQGKQHATVIWKYDPAIDSFKVITALPEPGFHDLSYPAWLTVGDDTYLAYYSSHRYRETRDFDTKGSPLADIFLAKLILS